VNLPREVRNVILRFNELFQVNKPIIGVLHLKPLPGSPLYADDIDEIIDCALRDAKSLELGGVDAVLVENFGDIPYLKKVREPETIAAMSIIVREIFKAVSKPIGINFLRNSSIEAAAIAYVNKARFIRVNAFIETIESDSGIIEASAPELLRYLKKIKADLGILADINVKHASSLGSRDIKTLCLDAFERGLATAVILTGKRTGEAPDINVLTQLIKIKPGPVLIGSGLNVNNLDLLKIADGAIVGTYFKRRTKNGYIVDVEKVKKFMEKVQELREKP